MNKTIETPLKNLVQCFLVFILLESCLVLLYSSLLPSWTSFTALFLCGWLAWTFVEYTIHRFIMHELIVPGSKDDLFHHHHHHQNPSTLKVTWLHRVMIGIAGVLVIGLAVYLNNHFTWLAGFFIGFLYYNLLHYLLHRPIGRYILPKIQRAHILHHTRYPRCGYSFSTILWDWLFDTLPPKEAEVTEQMKKNYFNQFTRT